jgi:hypothetical protein
LLSEALAAAKRGCERHKLDRPRIPPGGLEREEPENDLVVLRLIPPFLLPSLLLPRPLLAFGSRGVELPRWGKRRP